MKIQKISSTVSPFSGISYVNNEFDKSGLSQLIDKEIGVRNSTKGYTYGNVIKNLSNVFIAVVIVLKIFKHMLVMI